MYTLRLLVNGLRVPQSRASWSKVIGGTRLEYTPSGSLITSIGSLTTDRIFISKLFESSLDLHNCQLIVSSMARSSPALVRLLLTRLRLRPANASRAVSICTTIVYALLVGSCISPDRIVPDLLDPQAWNWFSYIYGNPVDYTDPSGHILCRSP